MLVRKLPDLAHRTIDEASQHLGVVHGVAGGGGGDGGVSK